MNVPTILRDAWFFYSRHLGAISRLCLPLILLESVCRHLAAQVTGEQPLPGQDLLIGLLFYPLYSAALILYLDARSRGYAPGLRQVFNRALSLWPAMAALSAVGTLAILLGASLFVLPGLWVMIRIAFAEYLLVLRGLPPLAALKESFRLTRGHFLLLLGCTLVVMAPLWLLDVWVALQMDGAAPLSLLPRVALDGGIGLLQLFATVVLFRCFMLCAPRDAGLERSE